MTAPPMSEFIHVPHHKTISTVPFDTIQAPHPKRHTKIPQWYTVRTREDNPRAHAMAKKDGWLFPLRMYRSPNLIYDSYTPVPPKPSTPLTASDPFGEDFSDSEELTPIVTTRPPTTRLPSAIEWERLGAYMSNTGRTRRPAGSVRDEIARHQNLAQHPTCLYTITVIRTFHTQVYEPNYV